MCCDGVVVVAVMGCCCMDCGVTHFISFHSTQGMHNVDRVELAAAAAVAGVGAVPIVPSVPVPVPVSVPVPAVPAPTFSD